MSADATEIEGPFEIVAYIEDYRIDSMYVMCVNCKEIIIESSKSDFSFDDYDDEKVRLLARIRIKKCRKCKNSFVTL